MVFYKKHYLVSDSQAVVRKSLQNIENHVKIITQEK